jgi:hypothetical protein
MSKRKTLTDPEHTVHPIKIARVGESVFKEPTPASDVLDAHWTAVRADLARRKLTENGGSTENLALLAIPNSSAEVVALTREQEEELIRLHVKPFVAPNAEPYSTNTGARKHSLGMGMSPHTSYTLDIEIAIANTGTSKGGWVTGVDRDTSYAGDVMLFPQVECVHKGFYLEDLIIAECDKYLEPVNEAMQVSADLPEPSAPSPALLSSAAKTTASACKAKKLPFVRLQAAEESTFKRDLTRLSMSRWVYRQPWKPKVFPIAWLNWKMSQSRLQNTSKSFQIQASWTCTVGLDSICRKRCCCMVAR